MNMNMGILGRKIGMTQIYSESGSSVQVTAMVYSHLSHPALAREMERALSPANGQFAIDRPRRPGLASTCHSA